MATGGGAYKYYDRMKEVLEVEVLREDEMECLIIGRLSHAKSSQKQPSLTQLQDSISSLQKFLGRCSLIANPIQCVLPSLARTFIHTSL